MYEYMYEHLCTSIVYEYMYEQLCMSIVYEDMREVIYAYDGPACGAPSYRLLEITVLIMVMIIILMVMCW